MPLRPPARVVSTGAGAAVPVAHPRPGEEAVDGRARDDRAATWQVSVGDGDDQA